MLNNRNEGGKRRPVDALFGDSDTPALPTYIVEPPQPSTPITPPVVHPKAEVAPEPSPMINPAPPLPVAESVSAVATPAEPASAAAPLAARPEDPRGLTLSFQIERLYDDVKTQLRDSPSATHYCFDLLLQARQAYERRDFATAEFFIQATEAKLIRSANSMQASRSLVVVGLWLWEIFALLIGGGILTISYVAGLTLFGLPVAAEFLVLFRALGWGMIGGVLGALYNLPWFIQFREYDPAYTMNYFARPFLGLLVGGILFLLSQAGILAANFVIGDFRLGPFLLYVFAVLAGFKQEYVTEFFDNLMKAIFRIPPIPGGPKLPHPPAP